MKSIRSSLPLLAIALLLGACNTVPPKAAEAAPAPDAAAANAQPAASKNLRKGMTETEIRAIWGEPKAVHDGKESGETILVYDFDILSTQRMVAASVKEVPAIDPINGVDRTVLEPVLAPQNVTVTQTIVLQLKAGKLAGWARQLGTQRTFN